MVDGFECPLTPNLSIRVFTNFTLGGKLGQLGPTNQIATFN